MSMYRQSICLRYYNGKYGCVVEVHVKGIGNEFFCAVITKIVAQPMDGTNDLCVHNIFVTKPTHVVPVKW